MTSLLRLRRLQSLLAHGRRASLSTGSAHTSPHVCIVGSGPAGFYTAQQLINHGPPDLRVDLLERHPVPFGLVRFGVAPDHPEVKNVDSTFTKVAKSGRVNFVGNVSLGKDVSLSELRLIYDAVVLAYGAAQDRTLDIPGENLPNVISARSFVGFYNGLPDETDLEMNLDHENAAVIGMGNVALDVARILLTSVDELRKTDITEKSLEKLSSSRVKNVYIIGRRGPLHVAFTIKELREMVNLPKCKPVFDQRDFSGVKEILPTLQRPRKRLVELLAATALDAPTKKQVELWKDADKSWHLKLLRTPMEVLSQNGVHVSGIKLGVNRLVGDKVSEGQEVVDTGVTEVVPCGLVLRSVGYKSARVEPGIPFDERRGVIPNVDGKVDDEPGLYCAGWLATGPRGVIVDTMTEAFKVGRRILHDIETGEVAGSKEGFAGLSRLLEERKVKPVSFEEWERVDREERASGERSGKPREKFTKVEKILEIVGERLKS